MAENSYNDCGGNGGSGYCYFADYYDILTQNIPYDKRGEYFHALICENSDKKNGILLDLACGTGSLSEVMAKLGYDVIGVDGSADMLSVALDKKACSKKDILYLCQPMEELDLFGTIDYCICALDSLNHITDKKILQRVFDRVSLFLNPNGIFIFDVNTPYKHEQVLSEKIFIYDYPEVYCVWQNSKCHDGIIDISLDLFGLDESLSSEGVDENDGDGFQYLRYCEEFSERAYSHEEILEFIENAGLLLTACYNEDSRDTVEKESQRAVYVCKKIKKD